MITQSRAVIEGRNTTLKPWFKQGQSVGNLSTTYTEYSGLTPGIRSENRNYLWAIDDGATNYLLAINRNTAAVAGVWTLSGITTSDVEDVTSAYVNGNSYVYFCDTGDNANARATFKIFRVKEPAITGGNGTIVAGDIETITCEFPAGDLPGHKDVECVMADWDTGDLYFVTKRITPIKCYCLPFATSYSGTQTLVFKGNISNDATLNTITTSNNGGNSGYVVAGAISPNGTEIVLRSYWSLYVWRRNKSSETIYQALSGAYDAVLTHSYVGGGGTSSLTTAPKCLHPGQEPQGESVCFDFSGSHLYTCSESIPTEGTSASAYPLFKYSRLGQAPTVVDFQNGLNSYTGCADTYLDSGAATSNFSAVASLVCDYDYSAYPTVSRTRQAAIKFDLTEIPSNAIITGAYLTIYINTEGQNIYFHKVLVTWADTSTWNSLTGGLALDNTDALTTPDAYIGTNTAAQGIDSYLGFLRVNMPLATVQGWVTNSATNFGWTVVGGLVTGDGVQIDSSESATQARKPKLTISYTLP